MKHLLAPFLAVAAGAALTTGCHTGGAYAPVNATKYDLENKSEFVELDARVQRSVTTSGLEKIIRSDGRLEVVANIRNREERRIEVQVNCVFKDENGFSTGDETPFQTLILTERAQESVHFISANDKAKRYTIRVREAH